MTYQEIESTRREREQVFRTTIAPAIAAALVKLEPAAGWRWVPGDDDRQRARLFDNAGASIWFRYDSQKQRVDVHGQYPNLPDGSGWFPRRHQHTAADISIGCSTTKPAETIARDIARRFLPEYRKFLGWAAEDSARERASLAAIRANVDSLIAAGAGALQTRQTNGETSTRINVYDFGGVSYGSIDVGETYVKFEISVTPECAIAIVQLVAAREKGGR